MQFSNWIKFLPVFGKCLFRLPMSHLRYMARQMRHEMPHKHKGKIYINTFFPPYPSPAFDRFLRFAIERRRVPYSTYFAVTDRCPFTCPHCSYGHHQKGQLDTQQALEVIRQIKSLGTITLGLTGGEPLVRDDLEELITATGEDMETILFTTGYQLTQGRAKQLEQAGLGCMMIGLESNDPKEHDAVRGAEGSFEEGLQAVEYSLAAGIYTAISTVATRKKVHNGTIEQMAELGEKLGVHEFRVLEPIPTGTLSGHTEEVLMQDESEQLTVFHKLWNRANKGPAVATFSHLESDEMFGCGAGFHHLFVDALGNVCPCDLTPLSFGNLLEKPLAEIWDDMKTFFAQPRRGCMMKEICGSIGKIPQSKDLPLPSDQTKCLCNDLKQTDLPEIYKRLGKFK